MSDFTNTLTRIEAGGSGQEVIDMLNTPLGEIEGALNTLSARINAIGTKNALIRKYVPLSTAVVVGSLVYFNYSTSRFEPALAALTPNFGRQGESIEAPSSRVEGMVIQMDEESDITGTVTGTLLCGGYWESEVCVKSCLGVSALAGQYFLSPTVAGTATLNPGEHLRQPVLSYYGNYQFCLGTHYLAHDSHFHSSAVLNKSWQLAADIEDEKSVEAPSGAAWGYAVEDDSDCGDLGEIDENTTAVFHAGSLKLPGTNSTFIISDGILWYKAITAPATGSVALFNHFPFAYGHPLVRTITAPEGSPIKLNRASGNVIIDLDNYSTGSVSKQPHAIYAIDGKTLKLTPVVPEVTAGLGIVATKSADGSVLLSSADRVGSPIDAYNVNHNGTHPASDGPFLYTMFPKGRESSLVMSLPVSGNSADTELRAFVWGALTGTGAAFQIKLYWSPLPSSSAVVEDMPNAQSDLMQTSLSFTNTEYGKLAYAESAGYLTITGNGMLYAELSIQSPPSDDVKLTRLGFKLEPVSGTVPGGQSGGSSSVGTAIVNTITAGENIASFKAVKIASNKLAVCKSSEAADCDLCVGVSIGAGANGDNIEYVVSGIIENVNQTLTPGLPVYIGTDGSLTQVDPNTVNSALFIQKVGLAVSATSVQIGVRPGILKE